MQDLGIEIGRVVACRLFSDEEICERLWTAIKGHVDALDTYDLNEVETEKHMKDWVGELYQTRGDKP